jgi:TP901 family phage tail tape measure protein
MSGNVARTVTVKLRSEFAAYLKDADSATAKTMALRHEMDLLSASGSSLQVSATKAGTGLDTVAKGARKVSAPLEQGQKAAKGFGAELDRLASTHEAKFNRMIGGVAGLGTGLLAAFGGAAFVTSGFNQQMSHVDAVLDTTGQSVQQAAASLDDLRDAAIRAGRDTAFSASEAAQAEEELAKAGVSTRDILGGALTGTLSLAAAGTLELGDAATYAARAMNIFELGGSAVGHVADVLAAGANKSAADVKQLADGMAQGGLVAHQVGLSLEDTVGVLSAFADRALVGSDAGTSLKAMFQALQSPSEKTKKLMQELGITLYDQQGRFIGVTKFADQLQAKLGGLSQAERDAAMSQIFGSDATRAATVLYSLGAKGLQEYIDSVNDSGAANETAAKKMDNLAGDVEKLKGGLETLVIGTGGANTGLRALVQTADKGVDIFAGLPPWLQTTATYMTGIGGAGLLATAGFVKARNAGKDFLETLTEMGPTGEKAAGALASVGKWAGIAGVTVAGSILAVEGIRAFMDWLNKDSKPVARNLNGLTTTLVQFANTGRLTGEALKVLGTNATTFSEHFAKINMDYFFAKATRNADAARDLKKEYTQVNNDQKDLDKSLGDMARNGNAAQAALLFGEIRDALLKQGYTMEQINSLYGEYNKAAGEVASANTGIAKGFADAAGKARLMAGSLDEAISKGQTLTDVWNELNGAMLSTDKAMLAANDAIQNVKDSFKENHNAITGNSSAALANRVAVGEAAEAAAKAAQAVYEQTHSIDAANAAYNNQINTLRTVLHNLGLNDAQINTLIGDYAKMPPSVTTRIDVPGLDAAVERVDKITRSFNALNGRVVTTTIITNTATGQSRKTVHPGTKFERWGGAYTHAAEGALRNAAVYSPEYPARYAYAEPATGGEAFIPKRGPYGRAMSILSTAADWYGARVVPRGGAGGSGGGTTHHHYETTVQAKYARITPAELAAIQQANEARSRVGRQG